MDKKQIKLEYKQKLRDLKSGFKQQKCAYRSEKRTLKEKYLSDIGLDKIQAAANPPKRTLLEEIGNAVTHGAGAVFAIVAFILMLAHSKTAAQYVGASIYSFGLLATFTISCLYHSFRWGSTVKRVFRRFDYSCIYLLIGATFAPILLNFIGGTYGIVFCIVQWVVIAAGITFVAVFGPAKMKWLHIPLYLLLGWSALLFVPKMFTENFPFFVFTLTGGVIYSLGIIPYAINKKAAHFLWHFFVLAGAVVQWVGIYLYIYPA